MNILFVCRGNTCRSALAEVIAKQLCRLPGFEFRSAGTEAFEGALASRYARDLMRHREPNLEAHRAQLLTPALIDWADQIWTMTTQRRAQIIYSSAAARSKTELLAPGFDLDDPIGGTLQEYAALVDQIEWAIKGRFPKMGCL